MRCRAVFSLLFLCPPLACGSNDSTGNGRDAASDTRSASKPDARGPRDATPAKDAEADAGVRDDGPTDDAHEARAPIPEASTDAGTCHATPGPADRVRKLVVSHPFANDESASADFEVFDLAESGAITEPNVHFKLGPTTDGEIAFTPDGAIGLVAEDDGTLGVFRFDDAGAPHVVSASLAGSYYATHVVMDPSGQRAYVLDDQTENNGGGIYVVDIACDGHLTDRGLLVKAKLPATVLPLVGGTAVVPAKSVKDVPAPVDAGPDATAEGGNDAVLIDWPDASTVLGTADPFGDDLAIVSSATLTYDGRYLLLGDNSQFSGVSNRIGVVRIDGQTLSAAGVVPDVNDPETLLASPFDDTVLMTSAFGNALFVIDGQADGGAPFALRGELTYSGATPQLPGAAVQLTRGTLRGRVLVSENQAIRQVQFKAGGIVTDLGPTATGNPNDFTSIDGCIGVQP